MSIPKDPILRSIIPSGLNEDLAQKLMEDDDLQRLSRQIVILESRIASIKVSQKDTDVKPLTNLADAMRKLIQAKAELEIQRHNLVPMDWVKRIFDIYMATFDEIIDDPHLRDGFLIKLKPRINALRIIKRGPKPGKVPEIQLLESPEE